MGFVNLTCEAVERRTICNSETTTTIFLLPPLGCLSAHKIAAKVSTFISNGFRESLLLNFDFLPFCFRSLDAVSILNSRRSIEKSARCTSPSSVLMNLFVEIGGERARAKWWMEELLL